ncbi:MAG: PKD domain-containing protein [Crocinitomicaceae bacterium]|nr:PKD domain-containing protein [Crocinitomicaceae bacterium]
MRFLFLFFCCGLSFANWSQDTTQVLFIGNSYTQANDLPTLFSELALSKGKHPFVDTKANGGFTFQSHVNDPMTFSKIQEKKWNYVVLQAQSQEPSFPYSQVTTATLPFAKILSDSIYANNYCSQPLYYMTWGRQNGDPQWDSINTFYKMNDRLRAGYMRFMEASEASVAPVGVAWQYVRDTYPAINLYSSDGSHPSLEGSYLAACVFYASIYRETPVNATYFSSVLPSTAAILQNAAALVVLDSLSTWKLRANNETALALFSLSLTANSITTQNESWRSTSYTWDFGDGTTSNAISPNHAYATTGTFTVQLIAQNECGSDTASMQLNVSQLGLEDLNVAVQLLNTGNNTYAFDSTVKLVKVEVLNALGQPMSTANIVENTLDLSMVAKGVYYVRFKSISGQATYKIRVD